MTKICRHVPLDFEKKNDYFLMNLIMNKFVKYAVETIDIIVLVLKIFLVKFN